ncbi:hypothetical protein BS50DRAFT_87622 [Corynespora cassiicola Philippines]|uniref:C6 finger domain-containing protein n=1 Tax=Corynespora cassiicola Philippines TaxID=1448308 RepID=A0A2T2NE70_CORCC|nr:hypothetical protein BS50DRAFT_87622 [Corynespora cassiicola Philippines]
MLSAHPHAHLAHHPLPHHPYYPPSQSPDAAFHGLPHGLPHGPSYMPVAYHPNPPPANDYFAIPHPPHPPHPQLPPQYALAPPPISPMDGYTPMTSTTTTTATESTNSMFDAESIDTRPSKTTAPSSVSSGQSPRLVDLLLPGTDLSVPPAEFGTYRTQHESFYQPTGMTPPAETMDDDVEEIPRDLSQDWNAWVVRLPSPSPSSSSSSSSDSREFPLYPQPNLSVNSTEMLTRRFDRDTCGILSVKDGPTENPWRTLVWPLARDSPALYHAIASMTSFHQSKDTPSMRIQGIDHMRAAVHALAENLENMRVDTAISTTLVLAFSESWDQHISTGINHIKGAKILIDRALVRHNRYALRGEEFSRLKFLCNTWIYMDVIARLTSTDDDESNDFDFVYNSIYHGQKDSQLDPLMGCAGSLFPIIGRVANLVRRVRRTTSNGPAIISLAMELKVELENWTPPSEIDAPEDETTSIHDSVKTATAYQYATLLYLHQAVPEIPSSPSKLIAKRVLCEIATVQPQSRSTIIHIYPMMAAGCEVTEQEDRDWVECRWKLMSSRMKLGIIEKCLDVTKAVWSRRDEYTQHDKRQDNLPTPYSLKREHSSISDDFEADGDFCWYDPGSKRRAVDGEYDAGFPQPSPIKTELVEWKRKPDSSPENLDYEYTVRGRLHWLGVMKDWSWEILLG